MTDKNGLTFITESKALTLIEKHFANNGQVPLKKARDYIKMEDVDDIFDSIIDNSEPVAKTLENISEKDAMYWMVQVSENDNIIGTWMTNFDDSYEYAQIEIESMIPSILESQGNIPASVEAYFE